MTGHQRRVLTLLGAAFFMTILDGTSLLTALPAIEHDLDPHGTALQWTVTAYAIAFGSLLILFGRAADLYGRRRMFLAGMGLRVVASLACGLAPGIGVLAAGRALQGVSAAIIAPAALSMVMNTFPEGAERNRALGVWGGLGGFGATAGLLLGGLLTDTAGWPWVFWVNIPVGAVVLLLAPAILSESRDRTASRRFDLAGAATLTPALVLLVYVIGQGRWAGAHTLVPLVAIVVLGWAFTRIEKRSPAPLIPGRMLRSRSLVGGNLLLLAAGMSVDGMLITLTGYAQQTLGWSAVRFGLTAAAMTVTAVAGGLTGQRLVTRLGPARVAAAGTVLIGCGCLLLGHTSWLLIGALAVFGAGMGATSVAGQIAALTGVAAKDSGLSAGFADTSFALGTAFGAAVCAGVSSTAGHLAAFETAAGFAAFGLIVAMTVLRPRPTAGDTCLDYGETSGFERVDARRTDPDEYGRADGTAASPGRARSGR